MNKYPQKIVIRVVYIWSCGDRYARIAMHPDEMERMHEDAKSQMMDEVNLFIGTHGHEFVKIPDTPEDEVINVCAKWKTGK